MGKTDRDAPTRVQVAAGERMAVAFHSRECLADEKYCTLPEHPDPRHPTSTPPELFRIWEARFRPGMWHLSRVQCYWSPEPYLGKHGQVKSDCGCPLCTDQWYRKRQNRRSRHQAKAQIKKEVEL